MNPIGRAFIQLHNKLYRATGGQSFNMGGNVLLLTTTGAKSGKTRTNPLFHLDLGDGKFAIFASAAGAPKNPAWFHNLSANPEVKVELAGQTHALTARVTEGEERKTLYDRVKAKEPRFAGYEKKTTREIPVVVLEPR